MEAQRRKSRRTCSRAVPLSKTERRRAKIDVASMNSLENVGDAGDDVADLVDVAEELEARGARGRGWWTR